MSRPRLRKLALLLTASVCGLLVAAIVGVNVYQRYKRHQAEKLLSEISDLELRHATYDDAQKIASEWHRYADVKPGCNRERCEIEITLPDGRYPTWLLNPIWLERILLASGLRPATIHAGIDVLDGVIWGKRFDLMVYVRNLKYPDAWPFTLMTTVSSASRLSVAFWDPQLRLHPDYLIGKPDGCEGPCVFAYAHFTPYADSADVRRLMQVNLECLTEWRPCQTERDILPSAWAQWERERPAKMNAYHDRSCSPSDPQVLGRDSAFAGIVEIRRIQTDVDSVTKVRATMVRPLKPIESWPKGTDAEFIMDGRSQWDQQLRLQNGSKVILLFDEWPVQDPKPPIDVRPCGVVPLNDANLRNVQTGVDEDYLSKR